MNSVTVAITNYNKVDSIKKSIHSTLDQIYANFSVLIIDGRSSDGFLEIIKSYDSNPKISLILQENTGVVKTMNIAANSAKGYYI